MNSWLGRYRSWVYGLGFGVQLGAGVTTVVVSSAVYVVWSRRSRRRAGARGS